ncbi:hypothetical protein U3516DRAFT_745991 [Neocallimastix sp. 'constans']
MDLCGVHLLLCILVDNYNNYLLCRHKSILRQGVSNEHLFTIARYFNGDVMKLFYVVDVNTTNCKKEALEKDGRENRIGYLIEYKAVINWSNLTKNISLLLCLLNQNKDMVNLVMDTYVEIKMFRTDVNRNNPIDIKDIIQSLIEAENVINCTNIISEGECPIITLFRSKNISLVQYLVEEGVDLSQIDRKDITLMIAQYDYLFEMNIYLHLTNNQRDITLMIASCCGIRKFYLVSSRAGTAFIYFGTILLPVLEDINCERNPIIDLNSNSITKKIPYKEESCSNHKTKEISLNIKYYFILLHSLITFRSFSTDFELYAVASFVLESHFIFKAFKIETVYGIYFIKMHIYCMMNHTCLYINNMCKIIVVNLYEHPA